MGTLIVGAIGGIFLGLIGAWFRAELSALYEPTIRWLITRGCEYFPRNERTTALAELLAMNAGKVSPTRRLIDAGSIYLLAHRTERALSEQNVRSTAAGSRRSIHKNMIPLSALAVAGSLLSAPQDVATIVEMFQVGGRYQFMVMPLLLGGAIEMFGFYLIVRHFKALRRVRNFVRAGRA